MELETYTIVTTVPLEPVYALSQVLERIHPDLWETAITAAVQFAKI